MLLKGPCHSLVAPAVRSWWLSEASSAQNALASLPLAVALQVMCFFTPKRPSELPTSLWVSCERLLSLAPTEVARLGPNTLKQLIAQWYQHHPAFAGLPFSAWCSSMSIKRPLLGGATAC